MRLFSEQEIGAILKRTAELAKQADASNPDGLSLEEIQQLAADAGLDPGLVARAAAELSVDAPRTGKKHFWGGPLTHSTDMQLDVPVDSETWESMLPAIRSSFGVAGVVSVREGTFEWTATSGENEKQAHVYVRRTPSGSRLHVFWSHELVALPFFIPTLMATILSIPILFEELHVGLLGIPLMVLIVGTAFMLGRFGVTSLGNRNIRKVDALAKDLVRIANESADRPDRLADETPRPVIQIDEIDDGERVETRTTEPRERRRE